MISRQESFSAIVLAGSRSSHDPVAKSAGVTCKALTPIGDTLMVCRVLDALQATEIISHYLLCGPSWSDIERVPQLLDRIESQHIQWVAPQSTPSTSAAFAMQSIAEDTPILLTTADHALLRREIVEDFCSKARNSRSDVVVGLVPYDIVRQAFPQSKRTVTKFKGEGYCGCNLFAFLTPQGRTIAKFWQQVEQERKKPLRLIRTLGWMAVLRYLAGTLSLTEGLEGLSQKLGITISAVCLPFPEAAVDVDTVADLQLVKEILRNTSTT